MLNKLNLIYIILLIITFINTHSKASVSYNKQESLIDSNIIKIDMDCRRLVNSIGGLNNINLLWMGDSNGVEYQYSLITSNYRSEKKFFYICSNNSGNLNLSDRTLEVLSKRNLKFIFRDPIKLFSEIFSFVSKDTRDYIMKTLNLNEFNLTREELNQARINGLMKIAKKNQKEETKKKKIVKKAEKKKPKEQKKMVVKQEEFEPEKQKKDLTPPKIIIAENITVNSTSYKIEGTVEDKGSKNIYVEIDGFITNAKNGKFEFERFSPVDEKLEIYAIDQWGNKSKAKIVNIKIQLKEESQTASLEKLNPSKIIRKINNNVVAVVIGIEKYDKTPNANYANLDAKYFYEYVYKSFGAHRSNIKLLEDSNANLIESLGILNKWLPSKIIKNKTELIIFFAGHGLSSMDGKELYLLPQDSDPDLLERTALSRTELFNTISKLEPKKVTIFFDTCFSGTTRDDETLLASARPLRIVAEEKEFPENFTIFSASQLDQISSGIKDVKHGIFSYFVMKGLEGKADQNRDRKISNAELLEYLEQNVSIQAAKLGRVQKPSLNGDPNNILSRY